MSKEDERKMIQKKIRSLIYAGLGLVLCVLLCGGIGMTAQAEEETYNGFTYYQSWSDTITISGYKGNKTEIVIPGEIKGKKVTGIGEMAFMGCKNLKSIIIPEGVEWISNHAFAGCSGLKSITMPDSITSISDAAFVGCSGLKSITMPKGVTSIAASVFESCSSLERVTIPKGVTQIYGGAFEGCSSLERVTIPEGVTSIGGCAFKGCSSLTSITIPKSVTWIGELAFVDCSGLTSITLPKSVTYIADGVFSGCKKLVLSCYKDSAAYNYAKQNNIPVKLIVDPAKKGTILTVSSKKLEVMVTSSSKKNPTVTVTKITDKNAKKLTIPATVKVKGVTYKVTEISDRAFKGNKKLTTVTIGSNVTTIGIGAFYGCKNLKKITVTAGKHTTINRSVFKGIKKNATITVKGTKIAKTALKKQLKKKSIGYVKTWKIK